MSTRQATAVSERMARQRERVLGIAVEKIAERGYDSVRLRDIASSAGVSIGLLQHYFGSREELLAESLEHHCSALLEEWDRAYAFERDPWRRIESLIDYLAKSHERWERAAVWVDFVASTSRRPELRAPFARVNEAWWTHVAEAVDDGIRLGVFKPRLERDDVVDLIVAHLDGATLALAGRSEHMSVARMRETAIRGAAILLGSEVSPTGQAVS